MPTQSIDQCIHDLKNNFDVIGVVNCDDLSTTDLYIAIADLHREAFDNNQRLIFTISKDRLSNNLGLTLQNLQIFLNDIDISNFFVCLVTTNPNIKKDYTKVLERSTDKVPMSLYQCSGDYITVNTDQEVASSKISSIKEFVHDIKNLDSDKKKLLTESKNFCLMPWIGINISPDSKIKPCCFSTQVIGDCSKKSLNEIWNSEEITNIRKEMLNDLPVQSCANCYNEEALGRQSLRTSANRRFTAHADKLNHTDQDGNLSVFELAYWDVRYNNLCNLACRSCGPHYSSSWHQISLALKNKVHHETPFLIAGMKEHDIYEQMLDHIDHVQTIYFAGGEPLIIKNFYSILEELDKRGRNDVHLIYNVNLTQTSLKGQRIFDLWKKFPNVAVGASLDGEFMRGEYLRQNMIWDDVVKNRQQMMEECPHVDFHVTATVGIFNALHVADFHKNWVELGLITPEQFNIQLLLNPSWMSVTSAPDILKSMIRKKYSQHLLWLEPLDRLGRATFGYNSILKMLDKKSSNQFDHENFWKNVNNLDLVHGTDLIEIFPELEILKESYQ